MTHADLSKKVGVSRAHITHYLSGRSKPPLDKLDLIARALDSNIEELLSQNEKTVASNDVINVPIIRWDQVSQIELNYDSISAESEHIASQLSKCGEHPYALTVKGDSMISSFPGKKSFNPDDLLIVDPDREAKNGNFVIASVGDSHEAVFKQYTEDGPFKFLKPLNNHYPLITFDKTCRILGLVVCVLSYPN